MPDMMQDYIIRNLNPYLYLKDAWNIVPVNDDDDLYYYVVNKTIDKKFNVTKNIEYKFSLYKEKTPTGYWGYTYNDANKIESERAKTIVEIISVLLSEDGLQKYTKSRVDPALEFIKNHLLGDFSYLLDDQKETDKTNKEIKGSVYCDITPCGSGKTTRNIKSIREYIHKGKSSLVITSTNNIEKIYADELGKDIKVTDLRLLLGRRYNPKNLTKRIPQVYTVNTASLSSLSPTFIEAVLKDGLIILDDIGSIPSIKYAIDTSIFSETIGFDDIESTMKSIINSCPAVSTDDLKVSNDFAKYTVVGNNNNPRIMIDLVGTKQNILAREINVTNNRLESFIYLYLRHCAFYGSIQKAISIDNGLISINGDKWIQYLIELFGIHGCQIHITDGSIPINMGYAFNNNNLYEIKKHHVKYKGKIIHTYCKIIPSNNSIDLLEKEISKTFNRIDIKNLHRNIHCSLFSSAMHIDDVNYIEIPTRDQKYKKRKKIKNLLAKTSDLKQTKQFNKMLSDLDIYTNLEDLLGYGENPLEVKSDYQEGLMKVIYESTKLGYDKFFIIVKADDEERSYFPKTWAEELVQDYLEDGVDIRIVTNYLYGTNEFKDLGESVKVIAYLISDIPCNVSEYRMVGKVNSYLLSLERTVQTINRVMRTKNSKVNLTIVGGSHSSKSLKVLDQAWCIINNKKSSKIEEMEMDFLSKGFSCEPED